MHLAADLELVEGLHHDEAFERYRAADIVVDQLNAGWYGLFAIEAMALGKPVVTFLHDEAVRRSEEAFGIRVPMIVLSPYSKQGVVSGELGEFSSVLRFIEDNWGLTQLTKRDRQATPMLSAFDFEQEPREPDPLPLRDDCLGPIWAPND